MEFDEFEIGSKVKLKDDPNSPVITVYGYDYETRECECMWFDSSIGPGLNMGNINRLDLEICPCNSTDEIPTDEIIKRILNEHAISRSS